MFRILIFQQYEIYIYIGFGHKCEEKTCIYIILTVIKWLLFVYQSHIEISVYLIYLHYVVVC